MEKLLDKQVHPSYKAPSLVTYLTPRQAASHAPSTSTSSSNQGDHHRVAREPGGATSGGSRQACRQVDNQQTEESKREPGGSAATGTGCPGVRPKTAMPYTLTYGQR